MKKYIVVEANDISFDLYISEAFDTEDEASRLLYIHFRDILSNRKGCECDDIEVTKRYYRTIFSNGDTFYGQVREVEV